ncbi:CGNR zinc finger domain-containing protein [Edaphobacter albus]|uniref:CGNR zinc finger domain-containing protein n=1 Tax=Edaphobacter sp. 4G125 TaxID=2763071 RepID=UPI001649164C|nr:ABATE domain-containing protein [Edaphobacter sp. 4G125]QNI37247.1 CGNR zinc finger domain-containing protein [Edaphobacter sp. 4G125]
MTKPFELVASHPVLDFVNTLDWRFRESGSEELLADYSDLLRFAAQANLLTAEQHRRLRRSSTENDPAQVFRRAIELREAMAQVFYALVDGVVPPVAATLKLDQYLHMAQTNRRLRWNKSRFELSWSAGEDSELQLPLWLLAQSASELLIAEAAQRVSACANLECRWLFLDTTKNHTRRWCDMKICGNRMKVRRFKAHRQA